MEEARVFSIHNPGKYFYLLRDKMLGGFITWMEKGHSAIFAFTSGIKAERYAAEVYPERPLVVYRVANNESKGLVKELLSHGIYSMLLDVPPEHVDPFVDEMVVRNYAIIDLKKAFGGLK